jgi:membrane-associated phospholipid phosphatase
VTLAWSRRSAEPNLSALSLRLGSAGVRDGSGVRPRRGWLVAGGLSLLGFVVLALSITSTPMPDGFDLAVRHAVLTERAPGLTVVMRVFTTLGTLPVVVGTTLTGALVLRRRTRSWLPSLVLAAGVAVSALATALVKIAVGRARPGADDRLGPAALDFAFPSGHTGDGCTALLLVTALICLTLPRSPARHLALGLAIVVGAGIGVSRVYLGYHWPTDVVGGWLVAATFTCTAAYVALSLRRRGTRAWPPSRRTDGTIDLVDTAC